MEAIEVKRFIAAALLRNCNFLCSAAALSIRLNCSKHFCRADWESRGNTVLNNQTECNAHNDGGYILCFIVFRVGGSYKYSVGVCVCVLFLPFTLYQWFHIFITKPALTELLLQAINSTGRSKGFWMHFRTVQLTLIHERKFKRKIITVAMLREMAHRGNDRTLNQVVLSESMFISNVFEPVGTFLILTQHGE